MQTCGCVIEHSALYIKHSILNIIRSPARFGLVTGPIYLQVYEI